MIGTQIYRILKSSSARIAPTKGGGGYSEFLFTFMVFMFCEFPDIAAGNFPRDVISTSTFYTLCRPVYSPIDLTGTIC